MTVAIHSLIFILGMLLLLSPHALSQGVGPCHPYPGAVAQDCLQLIGDNLRNDNELACENATITLRQCSIVTKCAPGEMTVARDEVVRRALTSIGACAFSDFGSISGTYTTKNGAKTCYLYPGRESFCS